MKKQWFLMIIMVFLLSACEPEEEIVPNEEYVPSYELLQFRGTLGDFYEQFGMFYAGRYYDDGVYVLCLRDDAPEEAIVMAEKLSNNVRLVSYSFADLWTVRLMVETAMLNEETLIYSVGIDESENTLSVGVDEDMVYPDTWEYYIQEGIITIHITEPITYRNN